MKFPELGQQVLLMGTITGVFCTEGSEASMQAFNVQLSDGQAVHTNLRNMHLLETPHDYETPAPTAADAPDADPADAPAGGDASDVPGESAAVAGDAAAGSDAFGTAPPLDGDAPADVPADDPPSVPTA